MKAERRHELKQNSLEKLLFDLPEFGRKYASQIVMGVILAGLITFWIVHRMNATTDRLTQARESLSEAELTLRNMKLLMAAAPGHEQEVAQRRQDYYSEGIREVNDALEAAGDTDPILKSQALICKGDLNFALANLPDLQGASTQPSLQLPSGRGDLLAAAESAYSEVLRDYPDQAFSAMAAKFGLAAIAEDRAALSGGADATQWDAARQQYQSIVEDQSVSPPYREYAYSRLQLLEQISRRTIINLPPPGAATGAAAGPARPTTQPSSTRHG
jgi:hypothetical protein